MNTVVPGVDDRVPLGLCHPGLSSFKQPLGFHGVRLNSYQANQAARPIERANEVGPLHASIWSN